MPRKSNSNNQRTDIKPRTNILSHQKMQTTMALLDYDLTGAAFKVALYLINLHNNEYGYAWPTFEQIMAKCRLRRETVNSALNVLRARGIVMSETKGNNRYYMAWDTLLSPAAAGECRKPALSAMPETGTKGVRKPARYTDYDPAYPHNLPKEDGSATAAGVSSAEGESEPPSNHPDVAGPKQWPVDGFSRLCEIHPPDNDSDHDFALKKYYKAHRLYKRMVPFEKLKSKLQEHVRSNDPELRVKLGVWLDHERWDDEPAPSKTIGMTPYARTRAQTNVAI